MSRKSKIDPVEKVKIVERYLTGKIESLAAISEENSAASEEVSAAVATYNIKLQDMMDKIGEFKKITQNFTEDINKYRT